MSYDERVDISTELMPVEAQSVIVTDGNIPPKSRRINGVFTCKGRRITTDIPMPWAKFIAESMNKYFEDYYKASDKEGKILATLVIPADPRIKEDGRFIRPTEDGRYVLSRSSIYLKWVTHAKRNIKQVFVIKPSRLPISTKVSIKCVYYVKPKKRPYSLGDLCAGTIDCLHQIGVISDITGNIVASMDGSRIIPTYVNYRTEVIIREYKEKL